MSEPIPKEPRWIFDLDAYRNRTTIDAKEWVESQFPEQHYGKDILIYEAWDMRALLEQSYMAGKESMLKYAEAMALVMKQGTFYNKEQTKADLEKILGIKF